jgi:hypothetical protein
MLLQLLPIYEGKTMNVDHLNTLFVPPTPDDVIYLLEIGEPPGALKNKALISVVLHNLSARKDLEDIATALGEHRHGFFLVY